jgi:hypothetical protein
MTRTAVTDADFYLIEQSLDDEGRQLLRRVREFMASCWRTTWAGSSPIPRRSLPTRAPARSTR